MPAVDAKVDRHFNLGPFLPFAKQLNTLAQLDAKRMITAGHCSIMDILSVSCVWYARHYPNASSRLSPTLLLRIAHRGLGRRQCIRRRATKTTTVRGGTLQESLTFDFHR